MGREEKRREEKRREEKRREEKRREEKRREEKRREEKRREEGGERDRLALHDFRRYILQIITLYCTVFCRTLPYLVARVTLSMSLKVSPILSFVRPVTTICK